MLRGGDVDGGMFVGPLGLWWKGKSVVGLRLCSRNRSAGSGREKEEDALLGRESRVEKSSSDEDGLGSCEKWLGKVQKEHVNA